MRCFGIPECEKNINVLNIVRRVSFHSFSVLWNNCSSNITSIDVRNSNINYIMREKLKKRKILQMM